MSAPTYDARVIVLRKTKLGESDLIVTLLAEDGSPFTAHTTALVPFALVDYAGTRNTLDGRPGALCDIAPTLLELVGLDAPAAMTGRSLLA